MHALTRTATLALAVTFAGCGLTSATVYTASPPPLVEQDRIAEAHSANLDGGMITYDIWYSGFFPQGDPIDLAVLREACRPGVLSKVSEREMAGTARITARMYTPREVTFQCAAPPTR